MRSSLNVDLQKSLNARTVTGHITRSQTTRVRLLLGGYLLKLAGWIIGFNATRVIIQ